MLQVSSFRRDSGPQVSAAQRLFDRTKMGGTWQPFNLPQAIRGCEAVAASTVDEHGTVWVHAYLVWPWLTAHVTVSRQGDLSDCEWAMESRLQYPARGNVTQLTMKHDQKACPLCGICIEKTARGGRRKYSCQHCGATINKLLVCDSCGTKRVWQSKKAAACSGCDAVLTR